MRLEVLLKTQHALAFWSVKAIAASRASRRRRWQRHAPQSTCESETSRLRCRKSTASRSSMAPRISGSGRQTRRILVRRQSSDASTSATEAYMRANCPTPPVIAGSLLSPEGKLNCRLSIAGDNVPRASVSTRAFITSHYVNIRERHAALASKSTSRSVHDPNHLEHTLDLKSNTASNSGRCAGRTHHRRRPPPGPNAARSSTSRGSPHRAARPAADVLDP